MPHANFIMSLISSDTPCGCPARIPSDMYACRRTGRDTHKGCRYWAVTNPSLHQGDLRHVGGIALAFAKLGDTSIAARTPGIARGKLVKNLLDDQFVRQGLQNSAARMKLDHHSLVRGLQSFLRLIFV